MKVIVNENITMKNECSRTEPFYLASLYLKWNYLAMTFRMNLEVLDYKYRFGFHHYSLSRMLSQLSHHLTLNLNLTKVARG